MLFHLVRHAAHDHLGRTLTGRTFDVALSDVGLKQARALGGHLAELGADAVLTSPRLRAKQTAEIIARAVGCRVEIADELDEIDFGLWSGQTFEALNGDPLWEAWNIDRDNACTPAGETMSDVAARLLGLIERTRHRLPGHTVALVSHGDVIKSGVCHYLDRPFCDLHRFEIAPASVTSIAVDDGGGTIVTLNQPCPTTSGRIAA
jgi:broad specificity phosphatase PhoE